MEWARTTISCAILSSLLSDLKTLSTHSVAESLLLYCAEEKRGDIKKKETSSLLIRMVVFYSMEKASIKLILLGLLKSEDPLKMQIVIFDNGENLLCLTKLFYYPIISRTR